MTPRARFTTFALALYFGVSPARAAEAKAAKPEIAIGAGVIVMLVGDREVQGVYLGRRDGAVWVGVDEGEIGLEENTVVKIVPSKTNDSEFLKRKAALEPKDATGHWKLAEWAISQGLESSAKSAAKIVVGLEPDHKEARQLLGHERYNGGWMAHDDVMREKGLVEYRGEWLVQAEVDAREQRRKMREDAAKSLAEQKVRIHTYNGYTPRRKRSGYSDTYITAPKGTIR